MNQIVRYASDGKMNGERERENEWEKCIEKLPPTLMRPI